MNNNKRPIKRSGGGEAKIYASISEAGEDGFNRDLIGRCLNGRYKQYKGFTWEYLPTTNYSSEFKEYGVWEKMIHRCHNSNDRSFKHYGGRGIIVCDRWRKSFISFIEDMGRRPKGLTLERIRVNGNYEPSN